MIKIKNLFRKTIVIDINLFPKQYKNSDGEVYKQDILRYEKDYNVNIIPLDFSLKNTKGGGSHVKKI